MKLASIYKDEDCLYLIQDLSGMELYDYSKAIVNFCDKETKMFEKEIDRAILDIFEKNGISIPNTEKSVLKLAFDLLKSKGKNIDIVDLYKDVSTTDYDENCRFIKKTKSHFTIVLETNWVGGIQIITIQCGVQIKEN